MRDEYHEGHNLIKLQESLRGLEKLLESGNLNPAERRLVNMMLARGRAALATQPVAGAAPR